MLKWYKNWDKTITLVLCVYLILSFAAAQHWFTAVFVAIALFFIKPSYQEFVNYHLRLASKEDYNVK